MDYTRIVSNVQTGEVYEIPLTPEEIAAIEAAQKAAQEQPQTTGGQ